MMEYEWLKLTDLFPPPVLFHFQNHSFSCWLAYHIIVNTISPNHNR